MYGYKMIESPVLPHTFIRIYHQNAKEIYPLPLENILPLPSRDQIRSGHEGSQKIDVIWLILAAGGGQKILVF